MAHLIFYEKPGCAGNARQRALLEEAGHTLDRRDLLAVEWTTARLLDFFGGRPVAEWFNRAAPRVKSGEVVPEELSAERALALMLGDPLLIRRPLMEREDGAKLVGFDTAQVDGFVGLAPDPEGAAKRALPRSMEGCAAAGAAGVRRCDEKA